MNANEKPCWLAVFILLAGVLLALFASGQDKPKLKKVTVVFYPIGSVKPDTIVAYTQVKDTLIVKK